MQQCLDCGYDLRGLPEPRCPECGRGFNPDDPATYRSTLQREPLSNTRLWGATASFFLAFATIMSMPLANDLNPPMSDHLVGVVVAAGSVCLGVALLLPNRR